MSTLRHPPRIYEWLFRHVLQNRLVLRVVDAERAHRLALATLRAWGFVPGARALTDRLLRPPKALRVEVLDLCFRSPLGVAAGMDKDAKVFDLLAALGFGSVEVGTSTNHRQPGRPGTRIWRLPDRALLNAMGFPNQGSEMHARRLARRRTTDVIGVNIGKSKKVPLEEATADYRAATRKLAAYADYLAINVSSPNTPGLRSMQTVDVLVELVNGVRDELRKMSRSLPVLVKLGPDLPDAEIRAIAAAASLMKVNGIIAVNTTTNYDSVPTCRAAVEANGGEGGVSGRPLKGRATEVLALLRESAGGLPLISVGGIEDADDAWTRILAGATLVQAHTGFVYGGPLWPYRLNRDLAAKLDQSPYATIADAVGKGIDAVAGSTSESSSSGAEHVGSHATTVA